MKNILVVEDNTGIREEVCDILTMEGFNISQAKNGQQGLKMVKEIKPNLILSDIVMPEMDGFEMYQNLIKNNETKNIPIIFLSAKADKEAIERVKVIGNGEYIVKPVDPDILINIINKRIK